MELLAPTHLDGQYYTIQRWVLRSAVFAWRALGSQGQGAVKNCHLQCRSYTIIAIYITVRDGELLSYLNCHLQCRSYTIIAIYITVRDGELLSYLSSCGCWIVESVAGRSWHWYLFHKDLRASKRANHISSACLLSFPACKTTTQGIHRALQAKYRPLISSAQNLTIIFLVSITSSPQIVSIVPRYNPKQISINTES